MCVALFLTPVFAWTLFAEDWLSLEQQADVFFQRNQWADAEAVYLELLTRIESQPQSQPHADSARLSSRCRHQLEQLARLVGRPADGLRFALLIQKNLDPRGDSAARWLNALHIAEYQIALSDDTAARAILQELLSGRSGKLKTLPRLTALYFLGIVEFRSQNLSAAKVAWDQVEQSVRQLLEQHARSPFLPVGDRIELHVRRIAIREACGDAENANAAWDELVKSLPVNSGTFSMRVALARQARLRRDAAAVERHVTAALQKSERATVRQQASALSLLATAIEDRDAAKSREVWLQLARALEPVVATSSNTPVSMTDLRTITEAFQKGQRPRDALPHAERWWTETLAKFGEAHRQTLAALTALAETKQQLGDGTAAVEHFRQVLKQLQTVGTPREQVLVLLRLAALHRSQGDLAGSEQWLRQAISLSETAFAPDDEDRVVAQKQLAALLPSAGRFREALELNQKLLDEATTRGAAADRTRADVLLNMAVIQLQQGSNDEAQRRADEALHLMQSIHGTDSWQLAAVFNVLAAIASDRGQDQQAIAHAEKVWTLCEQHDRSNHVDAATAQQWLGALNARRQHHAEAFRHWRFAADIFRSLGQPAREAHVLSLIGGLALQNDDQDFAASALNDAEALLRGQSQSPLTRYVVSAHQALRHHRNGDHEQAIRLLQQSLEVAEWSRHETAGAAEAGRARFFAKFAPAFERLIEWNLQASQQPAAFLAVEQSRSRTFLDQMQIAGLDLSGTLPVAERSRLLPLERTLSEQLGQARRQLADVTVSVNPEAAEEASANTLQLAVTKLESEYAQTWRAIRDASPVYAQLLVGRESLCGLEQLQRDVLPPDAVMLFFQLGQRSSSVWIIGDKNQPVEIVPLELKHQLPALQFEQKVASSPTRELIGRLSVNKGLLKSGMDAVSPGPLTRELASRLVTWYLAATVPMTPGGTRGLSGTVATVKGNAITATSLSLVAETLIPQKVREIIRRRHPRSIVIVPDAALHELPFESLMFASGTEARFVLDEWPPISYCPSATVFARLQQRATKFQSKNDGLLIVGHSASDGNEAVATNGLSPLPGVAAECRLIQTVWPKSVTTLLDRDAQESRVLAQLGSHRVAHFATHGFVEEHADNLFGGLFLAAASTSDGNRDDGQLSYLDILRRDLSGCELAVLSACQTSVGPDRPMEASTSLAQAFLAAGAHQVVASLWRVSDESTTELMSEFYRHLATDVSAGRPLQVAEALHLAKLHLRSQPKWSSPAHWAPFIHVGSVPHRQDESRP